MELRKFKEKNPKKVGIILFTITCILLISGVILYRTFAIFQVDTTQNVINGSIEDPGDIYFAFYKDGNIQKEMPKKSDGYVLDESQSYCGVTGAKDSKITISITDEETIKINGVTTSRTKCNLYFVKGVYILGKGIPFETESDGLYEVTHENVTGTINDTGFQKTEYRYSGSDPDNYITFNNEDWRIIGLVNVMTSNNNVEQRVKIVKNKNIGSYSWDTSQNSQGIITGKNKWNESDMMILLNDYYYNNKTSQQCWQYESGFKVKSISCSFDGIDNHVKGLKSVWSIIDEDIIWTLGEAFDTNITTPNAYQKERIVSGEDNKWPNETSKSTYHSIGLMYPSDYGYAYGNQSCIENTTLGTANNSQCYETNWFYVGAFSHAWLLTSSNKSESVVHFLNASSYLSDMSDAYGSNGVYPVLYLKPNVKIISGDGSSSNPYQLVQVLNF